MSPAENTHSADSILANIVPVDEIEQRVQLLVCLMSAQKEYDPSGADHGRSAIYKMLLVVIEHVSQIVPQRTDLVNPLLDLLYGLKSLDVGSVVPMLTPVKLNNRSPNPIPRELFRADAAALMEFKQRQGAGNDIAAGHVARDLNRLGCRDDGSKVYKKGVVVWRNKVMSPADAACPYASRYDFILAELTGKFPKDPEKAYRYLLDIVRDRYAPPAPGKGGA